MSIRRAFNIFLVCFVALSGFSSTKPDVAQKKDSRPDWLSGKSARHPDGDCIIGVGSGKTREAAENNARANIGRVFRVDLRSTLKVTREEQLIRRDGETSSDIVDRTKATVDVGLVKTLEGTEIAEVWQDDESKTFYALAILSRSKAARILEDRSAEIDEAVKSLNGQIAQALRRLEIAQLMGRKRKLLETQRELNTDYRVVTGNRLQTAFSYEEELNEILQFMREELRVTVEAKGDDTHQLLEVVERRLADHGLTPKRTTGGMSAKADVKIVIELKLNPASAPVDEWYYCPWQMTIQAMDGETGKTIAVESKNGRASQLSVESAKRRAVFEASKHVGDAAGTVAKALLGE